MTISQEMIQDRNQQALAIILAARLEREHTARSEGQPSPLLDKAESVVPLVEANAAAFIAECDAQGIASTPDDSVRA